MHFEPETSRVRALTLFPQIWEPGRSERYGRVFQSGMKQTSSVHNEISSKKSSASRSLGKTTRKEPLEYLKISVMTEARGSLRMPPTVMGNFLVQNESTSFL